MPGECNFTGCKADLVALSLFVRNQRHHSQGLIELQMRAYGGSKTDMMSQLPLMWLLDAAKLAATSLFLCVHCLKVVDPILSLFLSIRYLGIPTGLGALLIRKESGDVLRANKRYYAGGTVHSVSASSPFHVHREEPHAFLEEGTPHYQGIAALKHCFADLAAEGGGKGMSAVSRKVTSLVRYLAEKMLALKHPDGSSICQLYGEHEVLLLAGSYFDESKQCE